MGVKFENERKNIGSRKEIRKSIYRSHNNRQNKEFRYKRRLRSGVSIEIY